jgi:hypothetical protein
VPQAAEGGYVGLTFACLRLGWEMDLRLADALAAYGLWVYRHRDELLAPRKSQLFSHDSGLTTACMTTF